MRMAFTLSSAWRTCAANPPSASRAGDEPGTMPTVPLTYTMPFARMAWLKGPMAAHASRKEAGGV